MPVVFANVLQPLIDVFESILTFFHDTVGVGWGFSIICMTIVVRAALVPLTLKQFRSMQAMQRLQPQIKELQAKYKDDRQRLNQEMMRFYQENKVNPFGSCLPLLLQLPVFFSLFYMLRKDLKHDICPDITQYIATHHGATLSNTACDTVTPGSGKFLFIPDLTDHATGAVLITLIVLYVGSQLLSSLVMTSTAVDRNQRMLMLALPFIFVPFVARFPAGLLVYWITTNVWTIGQQYVVKRTVHAPEPVVAAAVSGGGGSKAPPADDGEKPKGLFASLAARVEAASDQQASSGGKESAKGGSAAKASGKGGDNGKAEGRPRAAARSGPPPQSPRKKKKRSGRRR